MIVNFLFACLTGFLIGSVAGVVAFMTGALWIIPSTIVVVGFLTAFWQLIKEER